MCVSDGNSYYYLLHTTYLDPVCVSDGNSCCYLLHTTYLDPVCVSDGNSYEREAIMRIIQLAPAQRKSPITREKLQPHVFPNAALRKRILEHESELLDAVEASRASLAGIMNQLPPAKRACP